MVLRYIMFINYSSTVLRYIMCSNSPSTQSNLTRYYVTLCAVIRRVLEVIFHGVTLHYV